MTVFQTLSLFFRLVFNEHLSRFALICRLLSMSILRLWFYVSRLVLVTMFQALCFVFSDYFQWPASSSLLCVFRLLSVTIFELCFQSAATVSVICSLQQCQKSLCEFYFVSSAPSNFRLSVVVKAWAWVWLQVMPSLTWGGGDMDVRDITDLSLGDWEWVPWPQLL